LTRLLYVYNKYLLYTYSNNLQDNIIKLIYNNSFVKKSLISGNIYTY